MMSTSENPRPKPDSRAPNRIRDPLVNMIFSSPRARWTASMCGSTLGRAAIPANDSKVSAAVVFRCAVQITVKPGWIRHSAKMMHATR
ncbi:Uncharacterised protein [Mycobacteroides abscessus subsp. abscessus]|nr:Uncharacterised protein [Mycobacteroides abscessus subsp. abscessus]